MAEQKTDSEIADEFAKEDVQHKAERHAFAERLQETLGVASPGGLDWIDRWLIVRDIENLIGAMMRANAK